MTNQPNCAIIGVWETVFSLLPFPRIAYKKNARSYTPNAPRPARKRGIFLFSEPLRGRGYKQNFLEFSTATAAQ